jgi:drug/metabolite transporter (DMT)-like permease
LLIVALSGEAQPATIHFMWAVVAGACGVVGLAFFYYALARGTMGVVAPLAALIGAGVPVLVAIVGGESVSFGRMIGIAIALVGVVLISLPAAPESAAERRSLRIDLWEIPFVVLAGLGFAGFFIFMDRATETGATWWPLAIVRVVGTFLMLTAFVAIVASRRAPTWRARVSDVLGINRVRESGRTWRGIAPVLVVAAFADLGGNVFYVLAIRTDALSVAVVLSSLYPVVTTVLAALLLHERLRALQIGGVILATIGVALLR